MLPLTAECLLLTNIWRFEQWKYGQQGVIFQKGPNSKIMVKNKM